MDKRPVIALACIYRPLIGSQCSLPTQTHMAMTEQDCVSVVRQSSLSAMMTNILVPLHPAPSTGYDAHHFYHSITTHNESLSLTQ